MSLKQLDLPSPNQLRAGWALNAAVHVAQGWIDSIYATEDMWYFHDGGGNWALLRRISDDKFVLIGMDHEYSETYFREAASYFQEEETDLLLDAPKWWGENLTSPSSENWVAFIYGWNGKIWQRADYDKSDGFNSVGLMDSCYTDIHEYVMPYVTPAPGIDSDAVQQVIDKAIAADANFDNELLEPILYGMDVEAAVQAGRKFLEMQV